MEVAGLILSVASSGALLAQIARVGKNCCNDVKNYNEDSLALALQMDMEIERTLAIRNILYGPHNIGQGHIPGNIREVSLPPLIEELSLATQSNVFLITHHFYNAISTKFQALQETYPTTNLITLEDTKEPRPTFQAGMRPVSGRVRVSWALWGKKKVQAVVDEYERWNERLFAIVQLQALAHMKLRPGNGSLERATTKWYQQAVEDKSVQLLGLDGEIELAKVSLSPDQPCKSLEVGRRRVELDQVLGRLRCGLFDGRDVIVDFKTFTIEESSCADGSLEEPAPAIKNRIQQLGVLLSKQRSSRFRLLNCGGFFRDSRSASYGFLFHVPPGRARMPTTLLNCFDSMSGAKDRLQKPSLESRFALSLALAVSLSQFHAVGWVHKSIRSENIIFFSPSVSQEGLFSLQEPWLVGFEYAREDPGASERYGDTDIEREIYRQPEQWGQPTRKFDRIHDIYSLGVVLLEIGLWRPALRLEESGFKNVKRSDSLHVQKYLLRQAKEKLPFFVGETFAMVVSRCLSGEFTTNSYATEATSLEETYQLQVSIRE